MRSRILRLWILSALLAFGAVLVWSWWRGGEAEASPVALAAAPTTAATPTAAEACAAPEKKPLTADQKAAIERQIEALETQLAARPDPALEKQLEGLKKQLKYEQPLWKKLFPIALLLIVIGIVVTRLPRVELGHSEAFRRRRLLNWLIIGFTYSFLYMARYNLNQFKYVGGLSEGEFGAIFGWGSGVYGIAFLLNGPLTDRWGGRTTIILAAGGAAVTNLAMGILVATSATPQFGTILFLYCANMYFQSFGAVSIVKVNGAWFHLRERGTFGGIFGILISLGLFFAYDGGKLITDTLGVSRIADITDYNKLQWLFFIPSAILVVLVVLCAMFVRDTPSKAGLADFDLGDASSSAPDDGTREPALRVIKRLLSNPVILTIAVIELCSGFLRQAILQWGRDFSSGVGLGKSFVIENWGVVSCIAGITGGMFAGAISDHIFGSRRGPVSAVLYSLMVIGSIAIIPLMLLADTGGAGPSALLVPIPWIVAFMSMAIIGVHGMLSGTASADFGGKKNTGVAVGIIDGFVYAGSMVQSFIYGSALPEKLIECADGSTRPNPAANDLSNWTIWPIAMIPVAIVGFALALRVWNARAGK
ncbi:MAG: MFS transporter [Deltaproteobacteria bacterium]|nr:MFS transporter [Deltaproteobacteria bacterium]